MSSATSTPELERATIKRITKRIVPFLIVLYVLNYLDRTNIAFSALQMNDDIGISTVTFGLGAGIFFLAYFLFEVPSNIALHRFGARRWIARIMISWGIVASAMAFIQNAEQFLTLRVLLGIAEAGFFPGIIFYLSLWFPARYRARVIALFYLGIPISQVIGAPLSAGLIKLGDFDGFAGWRTMYLVEGLPAVILGIVTIFYLTDRPTQAKWLNPDQREWLSAELDREEQLKHLEVGSASSKGAQVRKVLANPTVWALALIYFGITSGSNAMSFFFPSVLAAFGDGFGIELGIIETGLITAIPYAVAVVAMILWSRHSDKNNERRFHGGGAAIVAGVSIAFALSIDHPVATVLGFIALAAGVYAGITVFWAIPGQLLTGIGAAAGIGLINSIGNLSGFSGPYLTGWLYELTGSYTPPFLVIAALVTAAGLGLIIVMRKKHVIAVNAQSATNDDTTISGSDTEQTTLNRVISTTKSQ